jgi:hypothetical protein
MYIYLSKGIAQRDLTGVENRIGQEVFLSLSNTDIVEGDTARGTTTLVYLQLHISLYTGTVHVLSRVLEYIR